MATNEILAFSPVDTGTNLLTQADYLATSDRISGNKPGVASARLVNKALRQSSLIAAGVAQFLANNQGANVTDNLTAADIAAMLEASVHGALLNTQRFTANGTYTPTPGTNFIRVRAVGGGGAGGGGAVNNATTICSGSGGAMGSYAEAIYLSGFAGLPVTIGAAGVGVAGTAGAPGGTTSVGGLLSCPGGGGGQATQTSTSTSAAIVGQGGPGGVPTGTGIIFATAGQPGPSGINFGTASLPFGGQGAPSPFGGGGQNTNTGAGSPASGYGAGGGGAATLINAGAAVPGGAGSPGLVIIEEFA